MNCTSVRCGKSGWSATVCSGLPTRAWMYTWKFSPHTSVNLRPVKVYGSQGNPKQMLKSCLSSHHSSRLHASSIGPNSSLAKPTEEEAHSDTGIAFDKIQPKSPCLLRPYSNTNSIYVQCLNERRIKTIRCVPSHCRTREGWKIPTPSSSMYSNEPRKCFKSIANGLVQLMCICRRIVGQNQRRQSAAVYLGRRVGSSCGRNWWE